MTERIVGAAASGAGVHARVLRIGQIVGDSRVGVWSGTEAIPLMIRSAVTLGVLPDLDEVCFIYVLFFSFFSSRSVFFWAVRCAD